MPSWCTHRIALVRGVIAASISAGSMLKRRRLDVDEHRRRAAVADGVGGGDERVADGDDFVARRRRRRASSARCSAVVQFDTAQACGAPTKPANSRSNAATSGPCVTQPDRITRRTASTSRSSRIGLAIGICCTCPAVALDYCCPGSTRLRPDARFMRDGGSGAPSLQRRNLRRHTGHDRERRDIVGHDGAGADDRASTDRDAGQNRRVGADIGPRADADRLDLEIGVDDRARRPASPVCAEPSTFAPGPHPT